MLPLVPPLARTLYSPGRSESSADDEVTLRESPLGPVMLTCAKMPIGSPVMPSVNPVKLGGATLIATITMEVSLTSQTHAAITENFPGTVPAR